MHSKFLSTSVSLLAAVSLMDTAFAVALPKVEKKVEQVSTKPFKVNKLPALPYFDDGSFTKRDVKSGFALRNAESFYYGDRVTNPIANVTGVFPGEREHVISMDRFAGMLQAVDCKNPDLMLDFKDKEGFQYAKDSWTWVNEHNDNTFIMVTNYDGCGPDNERAPFQVTDITYDHVNYKAHLKATELQWEEAFPHWTVHAHTGGLAPHNSLQARFDIDNSKTLDMSADFSKNLISAQVSGIELGIDCDPCGTAGKIDIEVKCSGSTSNIFNDDDVIQEFTVNVIPKSLSAFMTLALKASGTLAEGWSQEFDVFGVALAGINIPLLSIGPSLNAKVGASIGDLTGEATVSYGATLNIPDDSSLFVDFKNEDNSNADGWAPSIEANGPHADASISAEAELFAGISLDFKAEIAKVGFEGGFLLKAPDLTANIKLAADSDGVCEDSVVGLDIGVNVGLNLAATVGFPETPLYSKDLFGTSTALFTTCLGFGSVPTPPANSTDARRARSLPRRAAALPTPAPRLF